MRKIKLFTHEAIVHSQLLAIETTLDRRVDYEISLNKKTTRSHIQFDASDKEIASIKANLGYTVMIEENNQWLPVI
jgi:hypothetical protein